MWFASLKTFAALLTWFASFKTLVSGWMDGWKEGWMDGWMEGWKEGRESGVKDCLQQSKKDENQKSKPIKTSLHFFL